MAGDQALVRGRFAPTPSGELHLGNVRTALLAWLQVRQAGGALVLRMEDIDRPRCRPHLAREIITDLRWLGLDWDEGPDMGGPFGPYVQSEREERYRGALAQLQTGGWLYPCTCSRAEIMAIARAPHGLAEEGPRYPGTCRRAWEAGVGGGAASGSSAATPVKQKPPSLRFALPDQPIRFIDAVAGPQQVAPGEGGDFVVMRADGIMGYQLAVVVDDAAMQITHVLRGADLLDSTGRQLWLYQALGLPSPGFAHVPLLLGPDGQRLSKRHGSVTVAAMRQAGLRPERLVGWLAHLSGLIDRPEPLRPVDLLGRLDLARLAPEPTRVSEPMLSHLRGG